MSNYTLGLFFHFVGLAALFVGYGLEWIVSGLLRKATTVEQVRAWLRVYRTSLPISGPGLPTLIRTRAMLALGIVYLMTVKPDSFGVSLVALGVAIVLGVLVSAGTFGKAR